MRKIVALISLLYIAGAVGVADDSHPQSRAPLPESGFISPHQYTSAFFGFAFSIPSGCRFQIFNQSESSKPLEHFLIGEKCLGKGLTSFAISATPVLRSADDEAKKAVLLPTMGAKAEPQTLSFGGRVFWRIALEEKTLWGQKVWRAQYATVVKGFVLLFSISSFNARLAADLREAMETIKFFEPSQAQDMAGLDSRPYLPETARYVQLTSNVNIEQLEDGLLQGNMYIHQSLGFAYQFPEGWVRSAQSGLQTGNRNSDSEALFFGSESKATSGRCVRHLVSFRNQDEGNRELDFNPRITIMAADPSCFVPDIKFPTSLEDDESVKAYNQALIHSLVGTRLIGREQIKLFGINLNDHIFLEITSANAEPVPASGLLRKIHSDLILTTVRNAWVMWLFESTTESEFAKLLTSSISFDFSENLQH